MKIASHHTVGILGGAGKTGRQFRALFQQQGFTVRSTGAATRSRNRALIAASDIVLFAVPLSRASDIIREELRAATRSDQLLLDVSSLKVREVEALMSGKGQVIGMHPLFGPSTDPKGETVILCPGRATKQTLSSLRAVLTAMGLRTVVMSPLEHDELMATIQVIPHLKSLLMADVLRARKTDLRKALALCTPTYRMEFNVIGRFLDDHPDLYVPILFRNPQTLSILRSLRQLIDTYIAIASAHDLPAAEQRYQACRSMFAPYLRRARRQSEACIRTLLHTAR